MKRVEVVYYKDDCMVCDGKGYYAVVEDNEKRCTTCQNCDGKGFKVIEKWEEVR